MTSPTGRIAFIGGGNMASAIIGGLVRQGLTPDRIATWTAPDGRIAHHGDSRNRFTTTSATRVTSSGLMANASAC